MKVQAQVLRKGDLCKGTKETVLNVSSGLYTPRGKIEVVLAGANGSRRTAIWNKTTLISIERPNEDTGGLQQG